MAGAQRERRRDGHRTLLLPREGCGDGVAWHRLRAVLREISALLSSQVRQQQQAGAGQRTLCFSSCRQAAQGWFNLCSTGQAAHHTAACPRPTGTPGPMDSTCRL